MPRQVWVGNVPLSLSEGALILYFEELGLPVPWKAVVRVGKGGNRQTAFSILTFDTVEDSMRVLRMKDLRWADGSYMLVRLDI